MAPTRAVGIRELKDRLSAYLREVKLGARILVLDRNEVVGELFDPNHAGVYSQDDNPLINHWSRQGLVTLPTGEKKLCPASPFAAQAGTAARLLDEERGD